MFVSQTDGVFFSGEKMVFLAMVLSTGTALQDGDSRVATGKQPTRKQLQVQFAQPLGGFPIPLEAWRINISSAWLDF